MTQPLAQYQLHHEVRPPQVDAKVFRQGWQVRTRLDSLLADRLIDHEQWQAARTYRTAWERVLALPGAWAGTRGPGGSGDAHGRMTGLVGVLAVLRRAERSMGPHSTLLCRLCVVEDRSWRGIGDRLGVCHHTARTWAAAAVVVLASVMEAPRVAPSRSQPVPPSNNLADSSQ
jgi:hypothetical protein